MTKEQKAETARVFTEELSRITGLPKEAIVVLFHELPYEDVASGGVLLSDRK
ncbi:MAG TPA: tautomerase family protein [Methanocorpusculum sp.]|jgi:4-oxalocrotonate tautomerase family enzyme|nr:tautomerase family protein [Methanocorpusculum sp.]